MEQVPEQKPEELPPEEATKTEEAEKIGRYEKFLSFFGIVEKKSKVAIILVLIVVAFVALVSFLLMAPFGFPENKMITIKRGASLSEVSGLLSDEGLIRSPYFFEVCAKLVGGPKPISAGQYLFTEKISACRLAYRIAHSISGIPSIRVTIPEGMSNKDISAILSKNIPGFDKAFFLEHARAKEGMLFPDTYNFPENVTALTVETMMNDNFNRKVEPSKGEIETSKHSTRDIVIMASLLEREARTEEDMALVSGVLWNRIAKGMPLQVDATFMYLLGKKSSELTIDDLRIKSTYNTYANKGLPAGPIGNPGIIAIRAAIHPETNTYLYYLSDDKGVIHYAKTFQEHIANKEKYLR